MRKAVVGMDNVRAQVDALRGKDVALSVNLGRNRFTELSGTVTDIHPSLFTVAVTESGNTKKYSYSYSDVLCGQVKFLEEQ